MKNLLLKAIIAATVFTAFSFAVAGYAYKRAKIENPDLENTVAKHFNVKFSSSNNGIYVTSDAENEKDLEKNQKTLEMMVQQHELTITSKANDILVEKSPDEKLHVTADGWTTKNSSDQFFKIELKGAAVVVSETEEHHRDVTLRIQVPGQIDTLSVATMSGNVDGKDIQVKKIKVVSMSGDIHLKELSAQNLEAATASGNFQFFGKTAGNVEVHSVSGNVFIQTPEIEKSFIQLKSVSGDILNPFRSQPKSDKKISVTTVSGDINLHAIQ